MEKRFLLVLVILCSSLFCAYSQEVSAEKVTQWYHFEKVRFEFNGAEAWYIKPEKALPNKPWVWRAHFPDWHTQVDSILVERGFHVAYLNTNNLYGHSSAMILWDKFYNYLVKQKDFAPKVALEGVSRGGLYSYSWAKRNPSKVSCIYAEAPVCDFKSWPKGEGKGIGSEEDWKQLLQVYGFSEGDALAYIDQPVDNLGALAAFKVPILHAISLHDRIVPPEENTFILVNKYIREGGMATVIPMTKGKQVLDGHHFEIENPERIADFIYTNSVPVKKVLLSEDFIHRYGNLNNTLHQILYKKEMTIAFLGGSITNMNGWRDKVSNYLKEQYPQTKFTFVNAGVPSLGSLPHAFRLKNDVFNKGGINLMFIESAVNDHVNGTTEAQQRKALEGIVLQAYQHNPQMDIVMMAFADEHKVERYKQGKVPLEVKVHEDIAEHYKLPFVNLAEEVSHRIMGGEFTWEDDFKDLHPAPFGQEIYFASIKRLLEIEQDHLLVDRFDKGERPEPLQKITYDNGKYEPVTNAIIKKDFSVNANWTPKDPIPTRLGFVNLPVLEGERPGAELELSFVGTAIGLAVLSGPDAGMIQYSIDGGKEQTLELFTEWSPQLHLPWFLLLGDDLPQGRHRLKLTIANDNHERSTGKACRIVHFLVNGE